MPSTRRWWTTSALAVALAASACTPGAEEALPPERPASPRGEVVVVVVGAPKTLDPYSPRATALSWMLARPVYRSLFRLDPSGSPRPDLAAELRVEGDAAVVRLETGALRPRDVMASARRARPPSGFAGLRVTVAGPRRVRLAGFRGDWEERLAVGTWVLPRGEATGASEGPYRVLRHRPGLEVLLGARGGARPGAAVARIRVRSAADTGMALGLLAAGRADVGWIPSTVNLEERAAGEGLNYEGALGWERVLLDFSDSALIEEERRWVARRSARRTLAAGFVREAGRVAAGSLPAGSEVRPASIVLAAPAEDELLGLVARAIHRRLAAAGAISEAVLVPAGDAPPRGVVTVSRALGAPGVPPPRWSRAWPLFRVESSLLWRDGIGGIEPNPTLDGPLWNAEAWRLEGRI